MKKSRRKFLIIIFIGFSIMLVSFSDLKYFILAKAQLLEKILREAPVSVTEVTVNTEINLYLGGGALDYYYSYDLFSQGEYAIKINNFLSSIQTMSEESVPNVMLSIMNCTVVKDGKLSFYNLYPLPDRKTSPSFYSDMLMAATRTFKCPGSEIKFKIGNNLFEKKSEAFSIGYSNRPITYNFYYPVFGDEEMKSLVINSRNKEMTIYIDKVYLHEYTLTPLQKLILGGN